MRNSGPAGPETVLINVFSDVVDNATICRIFIQIHVSWRESFEG